MAQLPQRRPAPWALQAAYRFSRWMGRALGFVETPTTESVSRQTSDTVGRHLGLSPTVELAALSQSAYPLAAVMARGMAMSSVPLRVVRGPEEAPQALPRDGGEIEAIYRFLEAPMDSTRGVTDGQVRQALDLDDSEAILDGRAFRTQMYVYAKTSGQGHAVLLQDDGADPIQTAILQPLHPQEVLPVNNARGIPTQWQWTANGIQRTFPASKVWHVTAPGWARWPNQYQGVGVMDALQSHLATNDANLQRMLRLARSGHKRFVLTPSDVNESWSDPEVAAITGALDRVSRSDGLAYVFRKMVKLTELDISADDLGLKVTEEAMIRAVLAVFGVPPVVLGLETANYATAKEQLHRFWESIREEATIYNEAWTRIVRQLTGDYSLRVVHDFSNVAALAISVDQIEKVERLTALGVDWADAWRMVGVTNPPEQRREPVPLREVA